MGGSIKKPISASCQKTAAVECLHSEIYDHPKIENFIEPLMTVAGAVGIKRKGRLLTAEAPIPRNSCS
jgi:hypothetical protein